MSNFLKSNIAQTKKQILILLFGLVSTNVNAQHEGSNYLGINIIPLVGNTFELGYEINTMPYLSFDLHSGYVFNSKMSSPIKKGSIYELNNKSGFFIKIGARYNFRSDFDKFAPFLGLNMVNSIAIEEGVYNTDITLNKPVVRNSYNLGFNGIIGITSPTTKRINIDLGLQFGKVIVYNLLDFHSYMPGMGVSYGSGLRIQGVLRIKYLIK